MKTNVCIYGGSFDPIHMGHRYAVEYILSTKIIDEVWVMPCWKHPFDKQMVDFHHRINMCNITFGVVHTVIRNNTEKYHIGSDDRIMVTDLEMIVNDPHGLTADILVKINKICNQENNLQFHIAIGSDLHQLALQGKWEKWDEMTTIANPLIIPRLGYVDHSLGPKISSTEIKTLLQRCRYVDRHVDHNEFNGLIHEGVLQYIEDNNLYG